MRRNLNIQLINKQIASERLRAIAANRHHQAKQMRAIILILILSLTISVSFSQETVTGNYFIEGKIIALLGIKSYPVTESVIELTGEENGLEESNDNGEFRFQDLKSGEYKIRFICSYGELDTIIKIENNDIKDLNIVFISDCEIDAEIENWT